eukprot:g17579.t1
MLILTLKDANNTLVHLGTVICDKNTDNYTWLYEKMRINADMGSVLEDSNVTIFTDQHKSHAPALAVQRPDVSHSWCLRHVILNLKQQVGQDVNGWIYHAARAATRGQFDAIMKTNVKPTKPQAFQALMSSNLTKWAFHAGRPGRVTGDQTTSNPVEQNMNMIGAHRTFGSARHPDTKRGSRATWRTFHLPEVEAVAETIAGFFIHV